MIQRASATWQGIAREGHDVAGDLVVRGDPAGSRCRGHGAGFGGGERRKLVGRRPAVMLGDDLLRIFQEGKDAAEQANPPRSASHAFDPRSRSRPTTDKTPLDVDCRRHMAGSSPATSASANARPISRPKSRGVHTFMVMAYIIFVNRSSSASPACRGSTARRCSAASPTAAATRLHRVAAGVTEGARTGLASVVTGLLFWARCSSRAGSVIPAQRRAG